MPCPRELGDDAARAARNRKPGQLLKQIAADFGISESCLTNCVKRVDVEDDQFAFIQSVASAYAEAGSWDPLQ